MIIMGVTSDKFGEGESMEILRQCDVFARKKHAENSLLQTYPSSVVFIQSLFDIYIFVITIVMMQFIGHKCHLLFRVCVPM